MYVIQVQTGCRSQDALSTHWAIRNEETGTLEITHLTKDEARRKAKSWNRLEEEAANPSAEPLIWI